MNTESTTLNKLEKVKAIAMAFCASGILIMGSTYFKPQTEYHVPRILYPVFEIFGNVGLAIGMILLGVILIYFAYKKYKENLGKTGFFIASIIVSIIAFAVIIVFFDKDNSQKPALTKQMEEGKKANDNLLNEITAMEKPNFNNAEVEKYVSDLEKINTECKSNNAPEFLTKKDEERTKLNMDYMKFRNLLTNKADQEKLDKYTGKLSIEFGKILQQQ